MKSITSNLIIALIVVVALIGLAAIDLGIENIKNSGTERTISVSGKGEVSMQPDIASFSVTSSFTESTSEIARIRTSDMINTSVDMLVNLGVKKSNIETGYISTSPEYRWDSNKGENILIGQRATQTINVKTYEIAKIGEYYEALAKLDGITISSVTLDKEDKSQEYKISRTNAIKDAYEKAKTYADALGMEVGDAITVTDGTSNATPLYRASNMLMAASTMDSGVSTEYYAGDITAVSNVQIIFELK